MKKPNPFAAMMAKKGAKPAPGKTDKKAAPAKGFPAAKFGAKPKK